MFLSDLRSIHSSLKYTRLAAQEPLTTPVVTKPSHVWISVGTISVVGKWT